MKLHNPIIKDHFYNFYLKYWLILPQSATRPAIIQTCQNFLQDDAQGRITHTQYRRQ